jgi:hypothetical protein
MCVAHDVAHQPLGAANTETEVRNSRSAIAATFHRPLGAASTETSEVIRSELSLGSF